MPTSDRQTAARGVARPATVGLVAVLVLCVAVTGAASAQHGADGLEANDARSTATALGDGGGYTNLTLHDGTDVDYFAVTAADGETVTATLSFDDDTGDVDAALLAPDGEELSVSQSVSDGESLAATVSATGTYYVRVDAFDGATASYDIAVNTTGDGSLEPDDDRANATQVGPGPAYYEASVDGRVDADYYAVEADANDTVASTLLFDGGEADLDLELVGEDGATLAASRYGTDREELDYTVAENGTYYLRVDAFSGAPADYVHVIDAANASAAPPAANESDFLEGNDGTASATRVGSGDSHTSLTVHDPDDADYFAVTADDGERITVTLSSTSAADFDLTLRDGSDRTLRTADGEANGTLDYAVETGGTYYVRVATVDGAPATYDLAVDTVGTTGEADALEPNDGPANATRAGDGDSYERLTLSDAGDADYFAVTADAGERVTANVTVQPGADVDLTLRDGSGETLAVAADGDRIDYAVERDGVYYVVATPHSGAPADYDLTVDTVDSAVAADAREPDDTHDTATGVGERATYAGLTIHDSGDADYFAVEADAGDTVTATLSTDPAADLDLVLEDASGAALDMAYYGSGGERLSYEADRSGTYYLRVAAFEGAPATYNLSVGTGTATNWSGLTDGADLRTIEPGETASGTVDNDDPTVEGVYYEPVTFEGESGQTVSVAMDPDGAAGYLALRDPDGEYVTTSDPTAAGDEATIEGHTLASTGRYTIVATSATGEGPFDYTLSLALTTTASADATPATPNALAANASQVATETAGSGASGPGFGAGAAVLALVAATLLGRGR